MKITPQSDLSSKKNPGIEKRIKYDEMSKEEDKLKHAKERLEYKADIYNKRVKGEIEPGEETVIDYDMKKPITDQPIKVFDNIIIEVQKEKSIDI